MQFPPVAETRLREAARGAAAALPLFASLGLALVALLNPSLLRLQPLQLRSQQQQRAEDGAGEG